MKRIAFFISMIISTSATAQTIESCAQIDVDLDRLVCYDAASGRIATETTSNETLWSVAIDKSPFDDSSKVILEVQSEEPLTCGFGLNGPQPARLILRCIENTTSMIIATNCHMASGHGGYGNVDLRVDNQPAFELSFSASSNHEALGLWNGSSSIRQIQKLFGGDTLLARFTPYGENSQTATFPISGIEDAIAPLREACHW
jgi:type VI secretion system protein VasI